MHVFLPLLALAVVSAVGQNMNPLKYTIANPPPGSEGKEYTFVGDHFEVDTPVLRMQYSQVYWQSLPAVPLPANIVAQFANSSIAVTGFEVNVLRRNNVTGAEESVPAYQSYNHHYSPNIISSLAEVKMGADGQPMGRDMGHGKQIEVELRANAPPPPPNTFLNQGFVHGNGQEHRQIYHGAPPGYAQTIFAPSHFILSPMQISTNDGTGSRGASGMLPRISQGYMPPNPPYSPLLECPCTTRIVKALGHTTSVVAGACSKPLLQSDCFASAAATFGWAAIRTNTTLASGTLAPGCSVQRAVTGENLFDVVFNTNASSASPCQGAAAGGPTHLVGTQTDLTTLSVDVNAATGNVTITMSGPAPYWYGVGFGASTMGELPYAIIIDGTGAVQERKLADHDEGTVLAPTVSVLSSSVVNGIRTVTMTRRLQGVTADYFTFSPSAGTINFINAIGATVQLTQHKARAAAVLELFNVQAGQPSCLCSNGQSTINGIPYDADCKPEPLSDLLRDNNPTCQVSSYTGGLACCVNGQFLLDADQTPPPFVDEVFFRFRFYYQAYDPAVHQEIHHVEWSINGCDSGAGGPNPMGCRHIEFDVVKGTGSSYGPDVQVVQSTFPAGGMLESSCGPTSGQCMDASKVGPGGFKLIMAAAHCHAPNCLRQQLINAETGEMLCDGVPVHGASEDAFDESGYLYTPSCAWGEPADGFLPPPVLQLNTTLQMVAFYNSTYGHPGQMGIWQMKGAYVV